MTLAAAHVAALRAAAAAADQPRMLFEGIAGVAREALGCALFTAMRFDAATMSVERLYSTDTAAYPVGGRKAKRDTAWGLHVLAERRVFVGRGEADIRAAFDDHATILGLGLRSIINVPVVAGGACHGTVNFLMRHDTVSPDDVAVAETFGLIATPAFLRR